MSLQRTFTYFLIPLALLVHAEFGPHAFAQAKAEQKPSDSGESETLYVSTPSQLIASKPGGRKLGEIYINTPVEVIEEKGDWSRIAVDVWIRSKSLASKTKKKGKSQASNNFIKVEKYSTRIVKDGLPAPRVYLALTLKNVSKVYIHSWSALLVAQQSGEVLFREPLADDTKAIAPGSSVELQFYWERNEKPFSYLEGSKDGELDLGFYKTKVNN